MAEVIHHLHELAERIAATPPLPGLQLEAAAPSPAALRLAPGGGIDFSGAAGDHPMPGAGVSRALTEEVREGGTDDRNRWSTFNEVAGHYLHCVRRGDMTLDEAAHAAHGWMNAKMVPPWPEQRFVTEWNALVALETRSRGALVPVAIPGPVGGQPPAEGAPAQQERGLAAWDVSRWAMVPPPARRFLVPGLMQAGVIHTLAAEGGAGKTFLCMDMGLRLAAAGNGFRCYWLGEPIGSWADGGTVVMLTAEDDQNELHIRLNDIDQTGELRKAAAGRFRPVPLINAGGAFPLVSSRGREPEPSIRWRKMLEHLDQIVADGGRISAVIIDTLAATLHGEDNKADVVTEYYTEAGRLCGRYGAAVVITHHIRKGSADKPIITPDDMKAAVRGSTAIMGSSRVVWGLWHASDYARRLKPLRMEVAPGVCYRFAVLKANNPEMSKDTKTLIRQSNGLLIDVSERLGGIEESAWNRQIAWLEKAIEVAAKARAPFTRTGAHGVYERREQLPEALRDLSKRKLWELVDELLRGRRVVQADLRKGGKGALDVPGGVIAKGQGYRDPGTLEVDWLQWRYEPVDGQIYGAGVSTFHASLVTGGNVETVEV